MYNFNYEPGRYVAHVTIAQNNQKQALGFMFEIIESIDSMDAEAIIATFVQYELRKQCIYVSAHNINLEIMELKTPIQAQFANELCNRVPCFP